MELSRQRAALPNSLGRWVGLLLLTRHVLLGHSGSVGRGQSHALLWKHVRGRRVSWRRNDTWILTHGHGKTRVNLTVVPRGGSWKMVLGAHHWPLHLLPDGVHPMSMHRMVLHLGGSLHSMVMHAWFGHHGVFHQPSTSIVRCNVHVRVHRHPSMSVCHTTTHVHSRVHLLYTIRDHVHLLGVAGHHGWAVVHHRPSNLHHASLL